MTDSPSTPAHEHADCAALRARIAELEAANAALETTCQTLAASEDRFRALFDSAGFGIGYYTLDGTIVAFNQQAAALMGGTPADFEGKTLAELFGDTSGADYLKRITRCARAAAPLEFEDEVPLPGGSRWFFSRHTRVLDSNGDVAGVQIISSDITQLKHTEQALREHQQQLDALANNAPGFVFQFLVDAQGEWHIPYISEGSRRFYGLPAEDIMRDARVMTDSIHPDDLQRVNAAVQRSVETLEQFESQHRIIHPDGGVRWAHVRSTPQRLPDGSTLWNGIGIDVTEQKAAEQALAASQARAHEASQFLYMLLDLMPQYVAYVGADERYHFINQRYAELHGVDVSAASEMRVVDLLPAQTYDVAAPHIKAALNGELAYYENVIPAQDGSLRSVHLTYVPRITEQGVEGFLTLIEDVTERRQIEADLRQSQERFEKAFHHHPIPMMMSDVVTGQRLDVNDSFVRLVGYSRDTLLGSDIFEDLNLWADHDAQLAARVDLLRDGRLWERPAWIVTRSGEQREVLVYSALLAGETGGVSIVTALDVTERNRMAADLAASEQRYREASDFLQTLLDMMPQLVAFIRPDSRYQFANRAHGALFGTTPDTLAGTHLRDVLGNDGYAAVQPHIDVALRGDPQDYEVAFAAADETLHTFHARYVPRVGDQGVDGLLAVIDDITERRRVEAAEREQRELAEALSEIALAVGQPLDLTELGEVVLDQIRRILPYDTAGILRFDSDALIAFAARGPATRYLGVRLPYGRVTRDAIRDGVATYGTWTPGDDDLVALDVLPEPHSRLFAPLIVDSEAIGLIVLMHTEPDVYHEVEANRLTAVASHIVIALQKADLIERLRSLGQRLVISQEEERRRLAHELHDDVGQSLTALRLSVRNLKDRLPEDDTDIRERIDTVATLARQTMEQIRAMSYGLRPPLIDTLGLNLAMQAMCEDFGKHVGLVIDYHGDDVAGLDERTAISVYRVLQESLNNVAHHAEASRVEVRFSADAATLALTIQDNGRGIDANAALASRGRPSLGLLGMRERAELLGGQFSVAAAPGGGTLVQISVPRSAP